jgi:hypothetical protein
LWVLVGTTNLKLRGLNYIVMQYSRGCEKLGYLTHDFLVAKCVTVQFHILMVYDIKKVSKIFEKEKGTCIIKLNLRSCKICFA